jgi:peptidoglycan/LPS O-acetylase OafA/YrhL
MVTQQMSEDGGVVREAIPSSDVVRVHFSEIDGLRALAIVAAVVYEATRLASPSGAWPPVLARVFADASQGLPLFFLLSGFVLAYPPLATLRQDGRTYLDVGRYLVKRILRIYPAYIVVLALAFVVPPLALQYGLPALANGSAGLTSDVFVRNLFFAGDGLANDGFRALALEARWYLLFPLALLLWSRWPRIFFGVAALAASGDLLLSGAHAWGLGALVPFMLGIVAADIRAGHHRFERFAFVLAGLAVVAAVVLERFVLAMPGPAGAAGALRVDPLWSIALFGLLVGAGHSSLVERVLSLRAFRFVGAASFGIALVVMPVSSFVVRQIASSFGAAGTAVNAIIFSLLAGVVIWQLADRWFGEGPLRREVANRVGPWLDAVLRLVRIDRVTLGPPLVLSHEGDEEETVDHGLYAPPPRSAAGDLATVSTRSGSPEELAAEILETKKRLSDRSSAIFADAYPIELPPEEPVAPPEPVLKPGFYRRSADTKAAPAAQAPAPVFTPDPAPAATPAPRSAQPVPISAHLEAPAYEHYSLQAVPQPPPAPAPAPQPQPVPLATPRPQPVPLRAVAAAPAPRPVAPAPRPVSAPQSAPPPVTPAPRPVAPAPLPVAPAPRPVALVPRPVAPTPRPLELTKQPAPQAASPVTPPPPTTRGPIKMRIGAPVTPSLVAANGKALKAEG